ncbi:MAG: DsbA family protein [bacterium]|nr:DsbA family protein [bacterium]
MATEQKKSISCWKWFVYIVLALVIIGLFFFGRQIYLYYRAIRSGTANPIFEQALDSSFSSMIANKHVSASDLLALTNKGAPTLGKKNAPLSVVEFVDFDCPYTRKSAPSVRSVMQKYADRVSFQVRDFPVTDVHPRALEKALAARCAHSQGRYWSYHDVLFANQDKDTDADLEAFASQAGLDVAAFRTCYASQSGKTSIQQDLKDGLQVGVEGTPTFFFNGIKIQGALDEATFTLIIDQFLKQKK